MFSTLRAERPDLFSLSGFGCANAQVPAEVILVRQCVSFVNLTCALINGEMVCGDGWKERRRFSVPE